MVGTGIAAASQGEHRHGRLLAAAALLLFLIGAAAAQELPVASSGLTLLQAVEAAMRHYPSLRVSEEKVNAAGAGIQLARTAYLPRVDVLAQANRATRNNVFGLLLPQGTIPSISGPVLGSNNFGSVWGSAMGALVSWEPFDFGFRQANVDAAAAAKAQSQASLERTRFDVAVAATDSFMTVLAAQEAVRAARAAEERAAVVARMIHTLAEAELRPGADAARADAEVAAARTQAIRAQQAAEVARAGLSRFVGLEPAAIVPYAPRLTRLPPERSVAPLDAAANPAVREQNATIEQLRAQIKALSRSCFPRFALQGAAYARGSGAEVGGGRQGGLNGLVPDTQNYALGFTLTFPLLDRYAARARQGGQEAALRAEEARYRQLTTDLKAQWNAAVASLAGTRLVAANTPVQVRAAQQAVEKATARYQSGLGTIDELAEAQRLLAQSEIDDSLARLGVWRALLSIAAAAGDLQPFLVESSS